LKKRTNSLGGLALWLALAALGNSLFGWPQDIAGGASSLVGQDIIGGASVVFRRPPRVRDLAGGASSLIVKHRVARKPPGPTEIARNRPPRPPRQTGAPEPENTPKEPSNDEKSETANNEGNAFYDAGQYARAVEAYRKALSFNRTMR